MRLMGFHWYVLGKNNSALASKAGCKFLRFLRNCVQLELYHFGFFKFACRCKLVSVTLLQLHLALVWLIALITKEELLIYNVKQG